MELKRCYSGELQRLNHRICLSSFADLFPLWVVPKIPTLEPIHRKTTFSARTWAAARVILFPAVCHVVLQQGETTIICNPVKRQGSLHLHGEGERSGSPWSGISRRSTCWACHQRAHVGVFHVELPGHRRTLFFLLLACVQGRRGRIRWLPTRAKLIAAESSDMVLVMYP